MKYLLIGFVFLWNNSFCQADKTTTKYHLGTLYYCIVDSTLINNIYTKVIGTDVEVEKNELSQNYSIKFLDSAGKAKRMDLSFEKVFSNKYNMNVENFSGISFFVTDLLPMGILSMFIDKPIKNNWYQIYRIEEATLKDGYTMKNYHELPKIDIFNGISDDDLYQMMTVNDKFADNVAQKRSQTLQKNRKIHYNL